MTKLDGDARGGAALSVKAVTGKPILFASTGEKLDQFERFHPDRMAQRILGMGDVMTLIEKAERAVRRGARRPSSSASCASNEFGLDDFLDQMRQIRSLGPLPNAARDAARRRASSCASSRSTRRSSTASRRSSCR